MDIFIVWYIMEYGLLILHWMIKRQLYVIQLWGGDIHWASVCGLRRGVRQECHLMSLIQSWIIYTWGLGGGGGGGGTWCTMATGFSDIIFSMVSVSGSVKKKCIPSYLPLIYM